MRYIFQQQIVVSDLSMASFFGRAVCSVRLSIYFVAKKIL